MAQPVRLTVFERAQQALILIQLPFVLLYTALTARFWEDTKNRSLSRVVFNASGRFLTSRQSTRQTQALTGTTAANYEKWANERNAKSDVEDLGQNARLLWINRLDTTKQVLLYCHGGGFVTGLMDFQIGLWERVVSKMDQHLNVVVLEYDVHPATFSTQLEQLLLGIRSLLNSGVALSDLYLAGDSAGGALIQQLLSHSLHPLPHIPSSPLIGGTPIGGVCLISPWVSLSDNTGGSYVRNDPFDIQSTECLRFWGDLYLSSIPRSQRIYSDVIAAPQDWFKGVNGLVKRILITAGSKETLVDDILEFADILRKHHSDVVLAVEKEAIHVDMFWEAAVKAKVLSSGTLSLVTWFNQCLRTPSA